jgi:hypothetical protein
MCGDTRIFRICKLSLALESYTPENGWWGSGLRYTLKRVLNETVSAGGYQKLYGFQLSYYLELSISGHFELVVKEITEKEAQNYISKIDMLKELSK